MANLIKIPNSTNSRYTRYTQGGRTDRYPDRLGWWERRLIYRDPSDIVFSISSDFAKRPDLVSSIYYNSPRYMWVILQYNNIVDINLEFVAGRIISFPTYQRLLLEIITQPTGGNTVDGSN